MIFQKEGLKGKTFRVFPPDITVSVSLHKIITWLCPVTQCTCCIHLLFHTMQVQMCFKQIQTSACMCMCINHLRGKTNASVGQQSDIWFLSIWRIDIVQLVNSSWFNLINIQGNLSMERDCRIKQNHTGVSGILCASSFPQGDFTHWQLCLWNQHHHL